MANRTCSMCNAEISDQSTEGLCVACLLRQAAMESSYVAQSEQSGQKLKPEAPPIEVVAAAFPHLEILELIGIGGMGSVFKARQPKLNRFVALKILSEKLASKEQFAARFLLEGQLLAKLNHPNIVTVHDFGESGGFYYLMMEYVNGVNLRQTMRTEKLKPDQALAIVPKICDALAYAHDEGVLHRDIKPENILLDQKGRIKIADFGIGKFKKNDGNEPKTQNEPGATSQQSPDAFTTKPSGVPTPLREDITEKGQILGTPSYMAPEQLDTPETVDHRADIYSLGVVFYELLTGELPVGHFAAPSKKATVGANVDQIVLKALEKDREKRQQTAVEMKTEIDSLQLETTPIQTKTVKTPRKKSFFWRLGNELRTWPVWVTILAAIAFMVFGVPLISAVVGLVLFVVYAVIACLLGLLVLVFRLISHGNDEFTAFVLAVSIVPVLIWIISVIIRRISKPNLRYRIQQQIEKYGGDYEKIMSENLSKPSNDWVYLRIVIYIQMGILAIFAGLSFTANLSPKTSEILAALAFIVVVDCLFWYVFSWRRNQCRESDKSIIYEIIAERNGTLVEQPPVKKRTWGSFLKKIAFYSFLGCFVGMLVTAHTASYLPRHYGSSGLPVQSVQSNSKIVIPPSTHPITIPSEVQFSEIHTPSISHPGAPRMAISVFSIIGTFFLVFLMAGAAIGFLIYTLVTRSGQSQQMKADSYNSQGMASSESQPQNVTKYCTNCGAEVENNSYACLKCGFATRSMRNYCFNCGTKTDPQQVICVKCGVGLSQATMNLGGFVGGKKEKLPAALFAILLGSFGVHKFYLESWGWGILYLLFCWSGIPTILGVVEGILFLTMDDFTFNQRYNQTPSDPFRW